MSILGRFTKRGRSIPPNATFRITQVGQDKLQEFSGDPKSRVLVALETRGTSDVEEIATASGLSKGQVERLVPSLIRGGYVQYITSSDIGD
jgi:DNA-binding MarR family transcriptional regulator